MTTEETTDYVQTYEQVTIPSGNRDLLVMAVRMAYRSTSPFYHPDGREFSSAERFDAGQRLEELSYALLDDNMQPAALAVGAAAAQ